MTKLGQGVRSQGTLPYVCYLQYMVYVHCSYIIVYLTFVFQNVLHFRFYYISYIMQYRSRKTLINVFSISFLLLFVCSNDLQEKMQFWLFTLFWPQMVCGGIGQSCQNWSIGPHFQNWWLKMVKIGREYSVMQSYGDSFYGDVALGSFNMVYSDENSI